MKPHTVRSGLPALAFFFLLAATPAAAQVRDAATAATGTGAVTGTVVEDGNPVRPVRRAVVTVNSIDPFVDRTTITDDAGRFVFTNLPPGRYSLASTKRGWTAGFYGARAIGRPGRSLLLAAGGRADATIRMSRGAVISGTILDQFGLPVGGTSLRVMRYGYSFASGERKLVPANSSFSGPDERGSYRIYGLAPGEYYIAITNTGAALAGGRDLHLTSEVDVEEAMKAAQTGTAAPIADVPQPQVGFSQTFYPGVVSAAQATPVAVRAGEERTGIDITIQYARVARVEGTILSSSGAPAAARVNLVINDPNSTTIGIESIRTARSGPDGRFTFAEIAPGPYVLSAHQIQPGPVADQPLVFSGATDVDVQSELVSGLTLTLEEGFSVSGTIAYDGAGPPPDFATLRVSLQPALNTAAVTVATGAVTTAADGRFTLSGVSPGRYRLTVLRTPQAQWVIRSAMLLGQDSLDIPVDVRHAVADAAITLTDRTSELSGRFDAAAGGSTDFTMILFSANRAHWVPLSRRILSARPLNDGSFLFRTVPPGDYHLAAVDDVQQGEWFDPSFLQRIVPGAIRVTIAEGEKKVQDIRAGGG